ncbi:MAG: hypothetical protein BHW64_00465 [Candidatus Melainabacteria bacterium LEY3_CP_29_8]|nr:MAG: hypothetical protein BHW64_00465 [Candidatus Melainabacteria bacterium LEY3_CP_29_8]
MNNQHIAQKDKVSFGMFTLSYLFGSKLAADQMHKNKEAFVNYAIESGQISDSETEMVIEAFEAAEHEIRKPYRIAENVSEDLDNMPKQAMNEAKKAVKEMNGHGFKGVVKGVSKIAGAPVSAITTTFHEVKKDLQDRPSTPREKKARIVVDTYTAGTAATGAAIGAIPNESGGEIISALVDTLYMAPKQRKLMVNEIADIYKLSREEKYALYESLNLDDYERFENLKTDGAMLVIKEGAKQIAKRAVSETVKESATQVASKIPGARPFVKAGVNSISAKTLGEKAIKECKRLAKRH